MFPRVASFLSNTIGYIIIVSTALMYMNQFIRQPLNEVFTIGLSAFALIAALSGLCYAFAPCLPTEEEKHAPLYAGEKFLHSCLLLLQVVLLKYAKDSALSFKWIQDRTLLNSSLSILSDVLLVAIGCLATYFCIFGFEAINTFLWKRYEFRWNEVHRKH